MQNEAPAAGRTPAGAAVKKPWPNLLMNALFRRHPGRFAAVFFCALYTYFDIFVDIWGLLGFDLDRINFQYSMALSSAMLTFHARKRLPLLKPSAAGRTPRLLLGLRRRYRGLFAFLAFSVAYAGCDIAYDLLRTHSGWRDAQYWFPPVFALFVFRAYGRPRRRASAGRSERPETC